MKKIISFGLVLSFLSVGFCLAQEVKEYTLSNPRLTPESAFYFLKSWWEGIRMFFTFRATSKAKLHLDYAEERLAELNKLIERKNYQYLERLQERYNYHLNKTEEIIDSLEKEGKDVFDLVQKLEEHTIRHQAVLLRVLEKVPSQAKEAIQRALEKSKQGQERAIQAIQKRKK